MRLLSLLALTVWAAAAQNPEPVRPPIDPKLPTIWVIGDSTANNADHRGWADPFADYFDERRVNVVNRARAGRSSRTFFTEGLWEHVRAELRPGDFVLIQFGHNDGGPPDKPPARGSLPGIGDESQDFTLPSGKQETVHTFGWYMRKFIDETKDRRATPILLSLTVRNIWKDGQCGARLGRVRPLDRRDRQGRGRGVRRCHQRHRRQLRNARRGQGQGVLSRRTTPTPARRRRPQRLAGGGGVERHPQPARGVSLGEGASRGAVPDAGQHRPVLHLPVPRDPKLPSVFLIGDSTVRNGHGDGSNGQWGWGEPIVDLFDPAKINVVNRAVGGLSSRTYLTQGHWDRVLAMLKPGDIVMMQFGHNDGGPADDPARARGSLYGVGDETREIDNPITKQHEVVHTFGWYLRKFIADARAKGATPIVCSLIPRKIWQDGKMVRNTDGYAGWAAEVARSEHVPLVDLNEIIARRYDALGRTEGRAALRRSAHAYQPNRRRIERRMRGGGIESAEPRSAGGIFFSQGRSCGRGKTVDPSSGRSGGRPPARVLTQD